MLESLIQKKITKYLKDHEYFYFKITSVSVNGIPDIFAIIEEEPVFIEVKAPNGRLSPIQKHQINRIRENGVRVEVVYSFEEFKEKLIRS